MKFPVNLLYGAMQNLGAIGAELTSTKPIKFDL